MFFFPLFHRYVHTDYIYHQWRVYHSDNIFVNHLTLFQALLFCTNKNQKKSKKDKQKNNKKETTRYLEKNVSGNDNDLRKSDSGSPFSWKDAW